MAVKASREYLSTDVRPSLVRYYEEAHRELLGKRIFIHPSKFPIFLTFSDDLRELGATNREYAFTVVKILKTWLKEKKLACVPINVFCGDWALGRFLKVFESESVEIKEEDPMEALLQSELMVARYYVSKNSSGECIRLRDAVKDLLPLLNKRWLELYSSNSRSDKFIFKAVEILAKEFAVKDALNYSDIIRKLSCKKL